MTLLDQLIQLAKEIENVEPIDWGYVALDEDATYDLLGNSVLDMYLNMDKDDREMVMLATVVKLVVENFVLTTKLMTDT